VEDGATELQGQTNSDAGINSAPREIGRMLDMLISTVRAR